MPWLRPRLLEQRQFGSIRTRAKMRFRRKVNTIGRWTAKSRTSFASAPEASIMEHRSSLHVRQGWHSREICRLRGASAQVERLWQVGDSWNLTRAFDSTLPALPAIYDRNVRAFGPDVQQTLADLRVGVVGCGGTGSAVAEQLVRLGVRHLTLLDPDVLSENNLTRVYGSSLANVGQPKVHVLKGHLLGIAPNFDARQSSQWLHWSRPRGN